MQLSSLSSSTIVQCWGATTGILALFAYCTLWLWALVAEIFLFFQLYLFREWIAMSFMRNHAAVVAF